MSARRIAVFLALACLAMVGGGCSRQAAFGFPERPRGDASTVSALEAKFNSDTTVADFYDDAKTPPSARTQRRNDIVQGQMCLIDLRYYEFAQRFVSDKQAADFVAELAQLSLGLATATVDSGATKTVLGAVMAGIAGGKASFDKTYYFEKTLQVLLSAMEARRTEVRAGIEDRLVRQSEAEYPLSAAITDLSKYYLAGTLMGVLETIQKDAGTRQASAESELKDIRSTGVFGSSPDAAVIRRWLAQEKENRAALSNWLDVQEEFKDTGGLPVGSLLSRGDLDAIRKRAIDHFNMNK
ncbi:MAG TPA: hypothetical protein PKE29_01505 [Phycisphaerales bacterium]|nr:hypothetical protein [Phycisphaerales bacterium]